MDDLVPHCKNGCDEDLYTGDAANEVERSCRQDGRESMAPIPTPLT